MSYLADDELGHSYILRYRALHAAGRLGPVWLGRGGVCWISPPTAIHPYPREITTIVKLRLLIDELEASQVNEAPQAPSLTKFPPSRSAGGPPLVRAQSA